jgi:broad specificity phosphatase PhoE
MTEDERAALAARLLLEQQIRFGGVKSRAYNAAGVNSATWERAIGALTIKPHKLNQILTNLWPESLGEWTRVPERLEPNEAEMLIIFAERVRQRLLRIEQLPEEDSGSETA